MPEVTFHVEPSKLQKALEKQLGVMVPENDLDEATYVMLTNADPEKVGTDERGESKEMRWVNTSGSSRYESFTVTLGSWNPETVARWIKIFKQLVD